MKSIIVVSLAVSVSTIVALWSPDKIVPSRSENISPVKPRNPGLDLKEVGSEYLISLHSAKADVVESALERITFMRIAFPKEDFRELELALYDLASKGATRSIRYKAYLAIEVFANPLAFKDAVQHKHLTGKEFYAELAGKIPTR